MIAARAARRPTGLVSPPASTSPRAPSWAREGRRGEPSLLGDDEHAMRANCTRADATVRQRPLRPARSAWRRQTSIASRASSAMVSVVGAPRLAAHAVALIVVVGSAAGCSNKFEDGAANCKPDPSPTLNIDTSSFPLGVVRTKGACTQVTCSAPIATGCGSWVGDMTSKNGERCEVFFDLGDRRHLYRELAASSWCAAPQSQFVIFRP